MLDIKTLLVCLFLIQSFLALVFFLYWKTQKTYPGFYEWTFSLFAASLAKILYAYRDILPDFLTIAIANTLSVLYFILMLDALKLYFTGHRLHREIYFVSVPLIIVLYYFTEYVDSSLIRTIIVSAASVIVVSIIIEVLLTKTNSSERLFSRFLALFYFLLMFTGIARVVEWLLIASSRDPLFPSTFNVLLLLMSIIVTLGIHLSFILLNFQKTKHELDKAKIESQKIADRYSLAASSAKAGLWHMDLKTGSFYWDNSLENLLGPETDVNKKLIEIWNSFEIAKEYNSDSKKICAEITDMIDKTTEFTLHHEQEGILHFMVHAHVVCNDVDSPIVIGLIYDVTTLHKAENALKEANKKLNLLYSITRHDILNKVNAVNGYSAVLLSRLDDPQMKEWAENIAVSGDMITHLISFTKQYQNLGVNDPIWQDISLLLKDDEFTSLTVGKSLICPESGILIYADEMLKKVFYNLIENSLRHGGNVRSFSFSYYSSKDGLSVVYQDDGVGIPDANKDKIFEKNYGKNTGLGLFFCREVLEISGLKICENGVNGEGVRFEIIVPFGSFKEDCLHLDQCE